MHILRSSMLSSSLATKNTLDHLSRFRTKQVPRSSCRSITWEGRVWGSPDESNSYLVLCCGSVLGAQFWGCLLWLSHMTQWCGVCGDAESLQQCSRAALFETSARVGFVTDWFGLFASTLELFERLLKVCLKVCWKYVESMLKVVWKYV